MLMRGFSLVNTSCARHARLQAGRIGRRQMRAMLDAPCPGGDVARPAAGLTCIEWKLRPGTTLKKASVFHTGSKVAVGTTPGSCGVSAATHAGLV
jgi:hypothetical protein